MGKGRRPPRPGQKAEVEDSRKHPPSPVHSKVRLSFEHYQTGGRFCLSRWDAEQIQSFLSCLKKLTERTWQQLLEGSSKDRSSKTGLNSTRYYREDIRNPDMWPDALSPELALVGVRASDRRRVFGVRADDVFYVLWFDERHEVVEG